MPSATATRDPATVNSLKEWNLASPSPPTPEWLARLDELLAIRTRTAVAKITELNLPEPLAAWVSEYSGLNDRGCHIWRGAIRTGGDDNGIFWTNARTDSKRHGIRWRYVDRWTSSFYRTVFVCKEHRLTLTYCEGDATLVHAPSHATWTAEIQSAARFYSRH